MGIRFYCPNGHKLNVKEFQAGRTGICPFCGEKMQIPLESTRPSSKQEQDSPQGGAYAVAIDPESVAEAEAQQPLSPGSATRNKGDSPIFAETRIGTVPADPLAEGGEVVWYVRPSSGGQFGPATPDVMRVWLAEERIGADSLVWREGWRDWQTAADVFPRFSPNQSIPGVCPSFRLSENGTVPFSVGNLAVAPQHSHPVSLHRRARAWNTRMVVVGSLGLIVVVLAIILLAVLLNR
jgi:hypothetical protein